MRTPAHLTGITAARNATGSTGPAAYRLRACEEKDCGQLTYHGTEHDYHGTERGGVFRCGPCDIEFCEKENSK